MVKAHSIFKLIFNRHFHYLENARGKWSLESTGNPFRTLEDYEKENLLNSLIQTGKVLSPLIVKKVRSNPNDTDLILLDGHHRWALLPEVFKQSPGFSTEIPIQIVEFDSPEEEAKYILDLQIGRRNLSKEEIAAYVNTLVENGSSKKQAIKEVAETVGVSVSTIKRAVNPQLLQNQKDKYKRDKQKPTTTESSTTDLAATTTVELPIEKVEPQSTTVIDTSSEESTMSTETPTKPSYQVYAEQTAKAELEAQNFNREEHLTINGLSEEERELFELAANGHPTLAILPKHEALFKYCQGRNFPHIFLNESCASLYCAPRFRKITDEVEYGDYNTQEELFELYSKYYSRLRPGLLVELKEQLSNGTKLLFAKWGDNDSLIEDCPYSVMLNLIE